VIRLNLGCGAQPEPGWVNLDVVKLPGVDVVHDLDEVPWPFQDGVASEVKGEDVFEHVADPLAFMAECWRVLVPGGSLRLRTTWWQAENAYTDPTHRRFCTPKTFDYWCRGTEFFERYGPAYARGAEFEKADVHVEGQELVVHLIRGGPERDRKTFNQVEWEYPRDSWDLCRARYEEALEKIEAHLSGGPVLLTPAEVVNEMRIIRMATMRKSPWFDRSIDPEDSSVTVGSMMHNAFEALGDSAGYPTDQGLVVKADHWFTRRYLPLYQRGKREYDEWLDALGRERRPG
jgi:hypothetical protein